MSMDWNGVFGLQTLWFFVPLLAIIVIGGPKTIWKWRPWSISVFIVLLLWGGTITLALFQGTASIEHPALTFGDLAMIGIGISIIATQQLPPSHWINSNAFMYSTLATGYLIGLVNEYVTVWSVPNHALIRASDWYHHAFYGLAAYWALYALIGSAIVCFRQHQKRWVCSIFILCLAWWGFWVVVQIHWHNTDREFRTYGWDDITEFITE